MAGMASGASERLESERNMADLSPFTLEEHIVTSTHNTDETWTIRIPCKCSFISFIRCSCHKRTLVGATEKEIMDDVVFQSDTVLSDIHLNTLSRRHLMVRLNTASQPVFLTQFKLLLDKDSWTLEKEEKALTRNTLRCPDESQKELRVGDNPCDPDSSSGGEEEPNSIGGVEALLDEDGDLEVVRKPWISYTEDEAVPRDRVCPVILATSGDTWEDHEQKGNSCDSIKIEHTMATPLEDVGKQVWRGAFLLVDYILSKQDLFKDCTVLELGGGTGIVSIIMAKVARTVYCTDVGEDLLDMCERNIALNKHFTEARDKGSKVKVRELDWLKNDLCTDANSSYSWSKTEIDELYDLTSIILAADVFYDDHLTDAFFKTLCRITGSLKNTCTIYLSIEKRLNFTLRHMDIACEAYSHFRRSLDSLKNIGDGKMSYTVEPVELSFPQCVTYERVEQLELWKITVNKYVKEALVPVRD